MILSAQVEVVNPQSRLKEILYLTSAADYTFGENTYIPLLNMSGNYSQTLFSRGTTYGEVSVGISNLELDNTEGDLDYLEDYGIAGNKITIHVLDDKDEPLTADNLYFVGSVVLPNIVLDTSFFTLMNKLQEMDVACTQAIFAGTNAGPVGLEGNDDTIKGQIKPMLFGVVQNIPLYAANTSDHVYSFNYNASGVRKKVEAITAVRDKGGEILFGADHATAELLQAATIAGGYYDSCIAEALIMFGTRPLGEVTADVQEAPLSECSAPRVCERILNEALGFVAGEDYVAGDLEALHLKNACPVGVYVTSDATVLTVISQILDSIGGWMCPESDGVLRFGRVEDPANGVSEFEITKDIFEEGSFAKEATGEEGKNTPCQKYELKHSRNWKPIPASSLLESIDSNLRGALSREYATETTSDPTVVEIHPKATTISRESLLVQARSLLVPAGECLSTDAASFTETQVSGSGGSAVFDGKITIDPGTGEYEAALVTAGSLYPNGNYFLEFSLISGTVHFELDGVEDFSVSNTAAEPTTITSSFAHTGSNITVRFTASTATGIVVVSNIRLRQAYPGLSVQEECDRRFALHSRTQARYTMDVDFQDFKACRPGQVVTLAFDRFGLSEGKKFLIIGKDSDLKKENINLDLWRVNDY